MRWLLKGKFKLLRKQTGFTFMEILVALAILSIIGVAFLNALFTASKALAVSQESTGVASLASSQAERIKSEDYVTVADYNPSDPANRYELIDVPANLLAAGYAVAINPPVAIISPPPGTYELQSITVVIERNGEGISTIPVYRVGGAD